MNKSTDLARAFDRWGGATAAFFSYTHWSHDICPALLVPLMPFIKEALGLNYLQAGLLLSAYAISSGLSQFLGGWLGDRLSKRLVIAVGIGGVGAATFAVGLSASYQVMLFMLVIMGVLSGGYHPTILSLFSDYMPVEKRGKAIAFHMVGGVLGFAMSPVLGGLIADILGWQYAFMLIGLPALAAVPLVWRRFSQPPPARLTAPTSRQETAKDRPGADYGRKKTLWQVLRPVAVILALGVLIQLVAGATLAFMPMYFIEKNGISATYSAMLVGIIRAGGLAGSLFGGWLSDRWQRRKAVILAYMLIGPALYLLVVAPANALLVLAAIAFGLTWLMRQTALQPYLVDNTPPYLRGTVLGIFFGLTLETMSLTQPVMGYFMDIYGIIAVVRFSVWITIALSLLALPMMLREKGR